MYRVQKREQSCTKKRTYQCIVYKKENNRVQKRELSIFFTQGQSISIVYKKENIIDW